MQKIRFIFFLCAYLCVITNHAQTVTLFDFESGNLSNWNVINQGGGVSITQEDKYRGVYAVKLVANASSQDYWNVQLETPVISTSPQQLYKISFWAKAVGGNGIIRLSTANSNQLVAESGGEDRQYLPDLNITDSWQLYSYEDVYGSKLKSVGNTLQLRFDAGKVANKTYYIDDVKIESLSSNQEPNEGTIPLAKNHTKFLGNITANNVPANFDLYWNQLTPENAGKWESVERQRNSMNWTELDLAYNHAKAKGYPFKFHTFVWGSQEPNWITSLPQATQKSEIEEFMQAVAARYPAMEYIDVVNEPLHAPSSIRQALGGDGVTGWDWIVWSFRKARKLFPNSKLLINDYNIINDYSKATWYLEIINILKAENLIDGIGIQCHEFSMNTVSTATMRSVLNLLGTTGLPVYVSELDISGSPQINEEDQYSIYSAKFPMLWEHEAVAGITLWGYITGATWKTGTGIVEQNGRERKAMTWLKNYMASEASKVPNQFEDKTNLVSNKANQVDIYPNPVDNQMYIKGEDIHKIEVYDISGAKILSAEGSHVVDVSTLSKGIYLVKVIQDSQQIIKKIIKD